MSRLLSLIPLCLFICLFLGSGIYFHLQNIDFAFYQIPAPSAVIPSVILAVLIGKWRQKSKLSQQIDVLIKGISNHDIIMMCLIFLLSGAFSQVTKNTGCIDSTVQIVQSILPSYFLLPGIFIIAAFISISIGTSMGTIATVGPIAVGIATQSGLGVAITVGTVVGGAMFGDNLSTISDVTIAAAQSQKARFHDKFRYNGWIAMFSAILTILIILIVFPYQNDALVQANLSIFSISFSTAVGVIPYLVILILSLCRLNVFVVLTLGLLIAGIVGSILKPSYDIVHYAKDIYAGFASMNEIMILSLFVGGLAEMLSQQGGVNLITEKVHKLIRNRSYKLAELAIGFISAFNCLCIANNTIAVVLAGPIAKSIAKQHRIPGYVSATWLDVFSCVIQGIIPYGAQILLASSIAQISPLEVPGYVFYCYILGVASIFKIIVSKKRH